MPALPLQLSNASGVPFYRQLHDQLAELIRSGSLSPGDKLPSVRGLAADTLVSVVTVRRTYADLEAAGLIVRRQGQGTFVAEGVSAVSSAQAEAEARSALSEAVTRARQLGLSDDDQRKYLETVWNGGCDV